MDICPISGEAAEDYHAIRGELEQYSPALAAKDEIIVANKMDLTGAKENLKRFTAAVDGRVLAISGVTGQGLEPLGREIWRRLHPEEQ